MRPVACWRPPSRRGGPEVQVLQLDLGDHAIEVGLHVAPEVGAPPLVFLHEGLGSVSHWKAFPEEVAARTGRSAIVISRRGHGHSSPIPAPRQPDFMHREAEEAMPRVLEAVVAHEPRLAGPWVHVGHSDGGSIALLHAAHAPNDVAGVVALAPHVFVEDVCVASIAEARRQFPGSTLRESWAGTTQTSTTPSSPGRTSGSIRPSARGTWRTGSRRSAARSCSSRGSRTPMAPWSSASPSCGGRVRGCAGGPVLARGLWPQPPARAPRCRARRDRGLRQLVISATR